MIVDFRVAQHGGDELTLLTAFRRVAYRRTMSLVVLRLGQDDTPEWIHVVGGKAVSKPFASSRYVGASLKAMLRPDRARTITEVTMCDDARRVGAGRSVASSTPHRSKIHSTARPIGLVPLLGAFGAILATAGCGDGEGTGFPVNLSAQGALVSVDSGDTTVGFTRGSTRVTEKTGAFKISQSPITKQQYQACVAATICKAPKLEECSDPALAHAAMNGSDESVALCVGRENAETYCKWVGGRLPTLPEWLRAARGPSVQEHPWGSRRASCAQHPKSIEANPRVQRNTNQTLSMEGCEAQADLALATQKHPAGAAASGMQDVLIAPSELLVGHDKSPFGACSKGQHCLIYGMNPGSIDSVKPYTLGSRFVVKDGDAPQLHLTPETYGFRCVVE